METKRKILLLITLTIAVPFAIESALVLVQKKHLSKKLKIDLKEEMQADAINSVKSAYAFCQIQYENMAHELKIGLSAAKDIIKQKGGISFGVEKVTWPATNQVTKKTIKTMLPKVMLGGTWMGQTSDPRVFVPVVDDISRATENTCTIFQRMDKQGNMIRVATSVIEEGKRAVGTFIPAVNPDGSPNLIIQTVLRGEEYTGRALVVSQWYMATYSPIKNNKNEVIGMLYLGVRTRDLKSCGLSLRKAIMSFKIKNTGYVYVLGGSGNLKGCYIISRNGERDGENIWSTTDANGNYFIQDIVNDAIKLTKGEIITKRYPWINPGEKAPRWKIAAITYFEPWDWVIGASSYEEEFMEGYNRVTHTIENFIWDLAIGGIISVLLLLGLTFLLFRKSK